MPEDILSATFPIIKAPSQLPSKTDFIPSLNAFQIAFATPLPSNPVVKPFAKEPPIVVASPIASASTTPNNPFSTFEIPLPNPSPNPLNLSIIKGFPVDSHQLLKGFAITSSHRIFIFPPMVASLNSLLFVILNILSIVFSSLSAAQFDSSFPIS